MPITHSRRPPGRRDTRRRPEGHATLAPSQKTGKRDVRAVAPTAQRAVAYLRDQGEADMANAVQTVLDYATAPTPAYGDSPISLYLDRAFRDHVKAQAKATGVDAATTVREGFEAFLAGAWDPPQPKRATHGATLDKVNFSVRVSAELIERVQERAAEYTREQGWPAARGYALNAMQVAAAYLAHVYPLPDQAPAEQ
ncbi:hypothetical protein ACFV2X_38090 [Streptomyces sp. NPDC059679]|uniref:hypothetical protein n=1 Tax=Streptomyces sp. NPDC059679 TaxID=3346903 RepID=UPI0036B47FB6